MFRHTGRTLHRFLAEQNVSALLTKRRRSSTACGSSVKTVTTSPAPTFAKAFFVFKTGIGQSIPVRLSASLISYASFSVIQVFADVIATSSFETSVAPAIAISGLPPPLPPA